MNSLTSFTATRSDVSLGCRSVDQGFTPQIAHALGPKCSGLGCFSSVLASLVIGWESQTMAVSWKDQSKVSECV